MKKFIFCFLASFCLQQIQSQESVEPQINWGIDKTKIYQNAKKLDSLFTQSKILGSCINHSFIKSMIGSDAFSEENPFFDDYQGYSKFRKSYSDCIKYVFIGSELIIKGEDSLTVSFSRGKDWLKKYTSFRKSNDSRSNNSSANDSGSSSSWQTAVLQGTADFMAQRFKDELTNFALNSLITNIKKKDSLKFKMLFPKTLSYINTYLNPNKNKGFYYSDLDMLRYIAEMDINNIANQLPVLINSLSGTNYEYKSNFFKLNSKIIADLKTYSNPEEIFDELARLNNNYEKFKDTKVIDSLEKDSKILKDLQNEKQLYLFDIFVNALKNDTEDATDIWVDGSDINIDNISNDLKVRFYYALLYEQTKSIKFDEIVIETENNKMVSSNSSGNLKNLQQNELMRLTNKSIGRFEIIEKAYKKFKANESEPDISDFKNLFIPVLETIDNFTTYDTPKFKNITPSLLEIEQAISNKDYQFVLPYIFNLLDELKIGEELVDKEFLNTISLIVNFTLVGNAEDMKNLLNTYALPIGSSSLKRTGKSNLSFNGYVGFTGGYEFADSGTNNSFFNLGLTAPIGLSLSHRYDSKTFISSGSIFLGFIDLGSLVNNSFEDNIEIQSDLSFQQFFVPSLGYFFNVKNSPFSFGMVGSYHFDSRALIDTPEADGIDVFRVNLSLLVDIPFFTLSHKN